MINFFKKRKDICRKDGKIYLQRWNLFECNLFSLKIHKILLTDDDCLHDHPWNFISIILKGGYVEYREIDKEEWDEDEHCQGYWIEKISKIYHPFNILYRKSTDKHRLQIHQTCWTFVISLKKTREWGFWTRFGFIKWFDYDQEEHC
jgi:hypothetical protein